MAEVAIKIETSSTEAVMEETTEQQTENQSVIEINDDGNNKTSTNDKVVVVATVEAAAAAAAANNNNNNNGVNKQAIYDVLGGNDQELARRQYVNDDDDSDNDDYHDDDDEHENGPLTKRKRLSLGDYNSSRDANETGGGQENENGGNTNIHRADIEEDSNRNGNMDHNSAINNRQTNVDENNFNSNSNSSSISAFRNDHNGSPETTRMSESINRSNSSSSDEPEQMRKLFIGGLDYKTSEETLKQHFERFGDVNDCVVMREPQSRRSRGFGFVIYANSSMVDRAQQARPHEVDGREVQSKRAIPRQDSGNPEAQSTVKKVYLGGLSDDIEESELRDYFKEFGNIVNINIVVHKDTGKKRGFAFVEYDDYDPVDKLVLIKHHTIKDKRIEAKKAIPKVDMDATRRRGDPRANMAGALMAFAGGPPLDGPSGGVGGGGGGGRQRPGRSAGVSSGAYLWGNSAYGSGAYPAGYTGQVNYGYPPHYHPPSAHYSADNWMVHGAQASGGGPYGFRGAHGSGFYGRTGGYSNPPTGGSGIGGGGGGGSSGGGGGAGYVSTADYVAGFPSSLGGTGGGPMRLSYQHRSLGPYGSGYGAHRGRG